MIDEKTHHHSGRLLGWVQRPPQITKKRFDTLCRRHFGIFEAQLKQWRSFCLWQAHNRQECQQESFSSHTQDFKRDFRDKFSSYKEAVKEILTHFKMPCELNLRADEAEQDYWMTLLEYLAIWYEVGSTLPQKKALYESTWKSLVEANILRPCETMQQIRKSESADVLTTLEEIGKEYFGG
jgi:hypothetical protein